MRLPRPPRPSAQRLSATLAILGVLAGVACLVVPVKAALDDEPLLRLAPFSPALTDVVTQVDCGSPVSNIGRRAGDLSLYSLARDGACRDAATRRMATAVAATAVIGLLGLIGWSGARNRELARA
ncbi:MAG TPA: hypothetical protein VJ653_04005 [Acidimicrobiales bacterium]|nr:hypothetical protein [Acidimicrobiales bacterium]